MFEKLPRAYIISMRTSAWNVVLLMAVVMTVTGEEWYEQGHQNLLDWTNFDSTLQQPGKFKFVKFFTRNCRYCRLLKQVEEELQQERKWGFEFHSVDCSLHYDLCQAKAAMTAFPYVAIYNTHGKLHGTIGGYYPLDTMREAFNTI
jgi:thioredoxin-related protein